MASSLEETALVLKEITKIFASADDAQTINEINKLHADFMKLSDKKQHDSKQLIRDLTKQVHQQEAEAKRIESPAIHKHRLEIIEREKENVNENIQELEKQYTQIKKTVEEFKREEEELKRKKVQLEVDTNQEVPKAKTLINLYQNITNIKWDYDSELLVKGSIILPKKNDIRPFELDPSKQSDFKITNYLWELMDA